MTTSEQIRAARAMLRWEQENLAEAAGVPVIQVERLELPRTSVSAPDEALEAITKALEEAGIVFLADGELAGGGPGVRFKSVLMDEATQVANDDEGMMPDQLNAENDG